MAIAILAFAFFQAGASWASDFLVNPIHVFLTARTSSALLTLRNTSAETLRFQVSAFAWDQSPQGEVLLSPTEDIVVFPGLVNIPAGAERKLRIGRIAAVEAIEKTYRIFIDELPPQIDRPADVKPQIQFLTQMGVPVFLQPQKQTIAARFEDTALRKGLLTFKLRNSGNSHFVPKAISVKGLGSHGETVFVQQPKGWYILAGGYRAYQIELPKQDCGKSQSVAVEAMIGATILKENLPIAPGFCAE